RDFKKAIKIGLSLIAMYLVFWFCIYRNFEGSWGYLWSSFQLTTGYSSALSTYAENNWWLLGGSLLSFFLVPFLYKNKRVTLLYVLFVLSIFTAWKHSYSREEEVHLTIFYGYLVLFLLVFLIYIDKLRVLQLALIVLALIGIHKNMVMTELYHVDERVSFNKSGNFYDIFFEHKKFVKDAISESEKNVAPKKLPAEVLKIIGNKTIDFYPFEISYVAANKLNWKPRPIIQAYNTYTDWLDKQDARYYRSDSSAEFILWEYTADRWGRNNLGEIDNRYVLNDEPNTIYELLNHYNAIYKDSTFILFKRNSVNNFSVPKTIKSEKTSWNQWIKVPQVEDGIIRAKMRCSGTLLRTVKSVLFKDEVFYMDCKLTNGNVIQYRIIPENTQRGLWINPLFGNNIDKPYVSGGIVDEIRFSCSNAKLMQDEINVDWDLIDIKKHESIIDANKDNVYNGKFKNAYSLFMQDRQPAEKIIFHTLNDFEGQYNEWSYSGSSITTEKKFNGKKTEQMNEDDTYSSTFSTTIDKYLNDSSILYVDASAWVKLSTEAKGVLVIQLSDDKGTFFWKARPLSDYINDRNVWEQIFAEEQIEAKNRKNIRLGIYINKNKGEKIWISDFDIKLYNYPKFQ
ncbi:MAG TPA: hypothetical protein VN922_20865, partial [Bacteroidia bacterium]|nr:hypothetical protein [Bacteroidia bacterium]